MKRLSIGISCAFCVGLGFVVLSQTVGQAQGPKKDADKEPTLTVKEKTSIILDVMRRPIDVRPMREKIKLKEVLEYFRSIHGDKLPIVIDKESFATELGADAPDPNEEEVSLGTAPAKLPTATALRMLLAQVGKGQATFVIRQGHVEITTRKLAATPTALQVANVTAEFTRSPLDQVLQDLADDTGVDIHLDPILDKKVAMPITVRFRNSSLESALVTVTEMAGLKYVVLGQSIFVTTPERAQAIQKEEIERGKRRKEVEESLHRAQPAAG